jgi:hypothetical protein
MIPKMIKHNGELFALKDIVLNQRRAKKIGNNLKRKGRLRFRIKFIDNKYCVYKEMK